MGSSATLLWSLVLFYDKRRLVKILAQWCLVCFKKWEPPPPLLVAVFDIYLFTVYAYTDGGWIVHLFPLEAIFGNGRVVQKSTTTIFLCDNDFVMHNNRFVFKVCEILVLTTLNEWKWRRVSRSSAETNPWTEHDFINAKLLKPSLF